MLTVLVSTISNSQVFLMKNVSFCYSHFLSKNISVYAILNDQNFNDTLTNNIIVLNSWAQYFGSKNVPYLERVYVCILMISHIASDLFISV